jgi:hypothetical protein
MKQVDVYGDKAGVATPNELVAENWVSELRAETLLELEGDHEHK